MKRAKADIAIGREVVTEQVVLPSIAEVISSKGDDDIRGGDGGDIDGGFDVGHDDEAAAACLSITSWDLVLWSSKGGPLLALVCGEHSRPRRAHRRQGSSLSHLVGQKYRWKRSRPLIHKSRDQGIGHEPVGSSTIVF